MGNYPTGLGLNQIETQLRDVQLETEKKGGLFLASVSLLERPGRPGRGGHSEASHGTRGKSFYLDLYGPLLNTGPTPRQ